MLQKRKKLRRAKKIRNRNKRQRGVRRMLKTPVGFLKRKTIGLTHSRHAYQNWIGLDKGGKKALRVTRFKSPKRWQNQTLGKGKKKWEKGIDGDQPNLKRVLSPGSFHRKTERLTSSPLEGRRRLAGDTHQI